MLDACLPLGPCVTSKVTFWPSLSDLKPLMLIAEKCANKSSLPSSGVTKPKPFESLNHLTVPVATCISPAKKRGKPPQNYLNRRLHMENQYCKNFESNTNMPCTLDWSVSSSYINHIYLNQLIFHD